MFKTTTKIVKKRVNKGFTLVELLVFAAIAGVLMIILLAILISFLKSRNRAKKLSALQDVATFVFNDLTQEVRWSSQIEDLNQSGDLHSFTLVQTKENEEGEEEEVRITYEVETAAETRRLLKNGEPISLPEIAFSQFIINDGSSGDLPCGTGPIPCFEIHLELGFLSGKPKVISDFDTTISFRKTEYQPTATPEGGVAPIPTLPGYQSPTPTNTPIIPPAPTNTPTPTRTPTPTGQPGTPTPTCNPQAECCDCGETASCETGMVCDQPPWPGVCIHPISWNENRDCDCNANCLNPDSHCAPGVSLYCHQRDGTDYCCCVGEEWIQGYGCIDPGLIPTLTPTPTTEPS